MDREGGERPDGPKKGFLARLGPGLVTGAADDDPSGIGTHSQVGAQFGYSLSWTFVLSFPLLYVIQTVAAEIGRVTGRGIAANLRRHYPRPLLWLAVGLLLLANIINLGADLSAMGAALQLLIGGNAVFYTLGFGAACLMLEVFVDYRHYASILKWFTLSLFTYLAVLFAVHVPWGRALASLVVPRIEWTPAYATAFVAILGTTISPYLFFWQAGQEIEEERRSHAKPLCVTPKLAEGEIKRIKEDTLTGMAFSTLISIAIVFSTAATLNVSGITTIDTAAQAAEALRPLAGPYASLLFAVGIIGTGLLAVPVLAGSVAYAVSELFRRPASLDAKPNRARTFYGAIVFTMVAGASLQSLGVNPVHALYWAAVINGVLATPLMALMMLIVANPRAMGKLVLPVRTRLMGWFATLIMAAATVIYFAFLLV
jgi:NRAMP (natural resistance-associated macrophage protein)-like metal ion transporter